MFTSSQSITQQNYLFIDQKKLINICPTCYSNNMKVKVSNTKNRKYYYCRNCHKYAKKAIKVNQAGERIRLICPICQKEELIRKGTSKTNKKVYFCHNCLKHNLEPIIKKEVLKEITRVSCITCQNDKLKKKGFDKLGKQIYHCSKCKRRTTKTNTYPVKAFVETCDCSEVNTNSYLATTES